MCICTEAEQHPFLQVHLKKCSSYITNYYDYKLMQVPCIGGSDSQINSMFLETSVYFVPRKIMGSRIYIAIMWMVIKIQSQF